MTKTQAIKYLNRAEKRGFVPYQKGLIAHEVESGYRGNSTKLFWGINIEYAGNDACQSFCPKMIWDADRAERMFPTKTKKTINQWQQ